MRGQGWKQCSAGRLVADGRRVAGDDSKAWLAQAGSVLGVIFSPLFWVFSG